MFNRVMKILRFTDLLWNKLFEKLSHFSKAAILSGMSVCAVFVVSGFICEIYRAATRSSEYILQSSYALTEGGFRCLLLGVIISVIYEFVFDF